jgi:hypothetical protein
MRPVRLMVARSGVVSMAVIWRKAPMVSVRKAYRANLVAATENVDPDGVGAAGQRGSHLADLAGAAANAQGDGHQVGEVRGVADGGGAQHAVCVQRRGPAYHGALGQSEMVAC